MTKNIVPLYLKYPIVLTVALALAISAAMLIGRAQPLPERVALLHLNDMCKLPCWIGITPGVTTYEQARAIIWHVYGERSHWVGCSVDFCIRDPKTGNNDFQIALSVDKASNTIEQIELICQSMDDCTRMSDIYGTLGVPTSMTSEFLENTISNQAYYINYNIVLNLHNQNGPELAPQLPINHIQIFTDVPNFAGEFGPYKWRGFYHKYVTPDSYSAYLTP